MFATKKYSQIAMVFAAILVTTTHALSQDEEKLREVAFPKTCKNEILLLKRDDVRKELKLDDKTIKRVKELRFEYGLATRKAMSENMKAMMQQGNTDLAIRKLVVSGLQSRAKLDEVTWKKMTKLLSDQQKIRLFELVAQHLGTQAHCFANIQTKLEMTEKQLKECLKSKVTQKGGSVQITNAPNDQQKTLLTDKQKEILEKLKGKPFKFAKN